ncbi:MAG: hypothetical protein NT027_13280 [Proteobacteria bacterium]|nr:hypothetical protein [Pseudomonadota bacterium]
MKVSRSQVREFLMILRSILLLTPAFMGSAAFSDVQYYRWTGAEDQDASLEHVLSVLSQKSAHKFTTDDFRLNENRDLAYTHFSHYPQHVGGVDVESASLRIWSDRETGSLIQVEAFVSAPKEAQNNLLSFNKAAARLGRSAGTGANLDQIIPLTENEAIQIALVGTTQKSDMSIDKKSVQYVLRGAKVIAIVRMKAARGEHKVEIETLSKKVVSSVYTPHPTGELAPLEVDMYPYYEEFEGQILPRERVQLTDLVDTVAYSTQDPFSPIRDMRYIYSKMNDQLAATPDGRARGFWSMHGLLNRIKTLSSAVGVYPNSTAQNGLQLAGKYCQVMIHPQAMAQFQNLPFTPKYSANAAFDWVDMTNAEGVEDYEIKVMSSFYGKPLMTAEDALTRPATRHPFHDARQYLVEGFDEMQVYYSVNSFFKTLHSAGFVDPELSTRPFTAYLFNPDIEMRDNAFYTNDTINFTTYSAKEGNMARDSLTIWHELGHGLMDRLMDDGTGQWLHLADTGGLSEGMADFVADLILYGTKQGTEFPGRNKQRIINRTGFLLTNEVHDDGEAYGGVMHDILADAFDTMGAQVIRKMTDLTMEAMRLTRFHPKLTAADFFDHMEFADSLGRKGLREPGEFGPLIRKALASRNFEKNMADAANFSIKYLGQEVSKGALGARGREVPVTLPENGISQFRIEMAVNNGQGFKWTFPVTVKAFKANRGALQGAIHWTGEGDQATEVETVVLENESQVKSINLEASGKCDAINRPDGSCSDYVYFLLFNGQDTSGFPTAKKRFYVKVKPTPG